MQSEREAVKELLEAISADATEAARERMVIRSASGLVTPEQLEQYGEDCVVYMTAVLAHIRTAVEIVTQVFDGSPKIAKAVQEGANATIAAQDSRRSDILANIDAAMNDLQKMIAAANDAGAGLANHLREHGFSRTAAFFEKLIRDAY